MLADFIYLFPSPFTRSMHILETPSKVDSSVAWHLANERQCNINISAGLHYVVHDRRSAL
jgi:hypothetical protein